jgi:hypothetical protein
LLDVRITSMAQNGMNITWIEQIVLFAVMVVPRCIGQGLPKRIHWPNGRRGIQDSFSFIADPDIHQAKVIGLARAAFLAEHIDRDQYGEMLELLDCAKLWANEELVLAELIGLFDGAGDIG